MSTEHAREERKAHARRFTVSLHLSANEVGQRVAILPSWRSVVDAAKKSLRVTAERLSLASGQELRAENVADLIDRDGLKIIVHGKPAAPAPSRADSPLRRGGGGNATPADPKVSPAAQPPAMAAKPGNAQRPLKRSKMCGVCALRRSGAAWELLILQADRRVEFPRGPQQQDESEEAAAMRELHAATGLARGQVAIVPDFRFSETFVLGSDTPRPVEKTLAVFVALLRRPAEGDALPPAKLGAPRWVPWAHDTPLQNRTLAGTLDLLSAALRGRPRLLDEVLDVSAPAPAPAQQAEVAASDPGPKESKEAKEPEPPRRAQRRQRQRRVEEEAAGERTTAEVKAPAQTEQPEQQQQQQQNQHQHQEALPPRPQSQPQSQPQPQPQLPAPGDAAANTAALYKEGLLFFSRSLTATKAREKLLEEAAKLFEAASAQGHHGAGCMLGRVLQPKDQQRAVQLFRAGAEAGHGPSLFWLACCHKYGVGAAPDEAAAARLFERALAVLQRDAHDGDAEAQFWLAEMHFNGHGVPADQYAGLKWYRASSKNGFAEARYWLQCIPREFPHLSEFCALRDY
jgi:TPR repeat protein/8-oxo-dGTP pyrophosphatase MutT (NUDIX family)